MTTTLSQTVFSPWLTPVRLVSTSNIAGIYSNGPNNNGVNATFTITGSSLTIDNVLCVPSDRILLAAQTTTYEQGIYIVNSIGASVVVLERADDQQSREQMKAGQYVAVGAGSVNAGNIYTLVEPLPNNIGLDEIIFNPVPSGGSGDITIPTTVDAIARFKDTNGGLEDSLATIDGSGNLAATSLATEFVTVGVNNIDSTDDLIVTTVGGIFLDPTGDLSLNGIIYPTTDGTNQQAIVTDGAGNLSFATVGGGGSVILPTIANHIALYNDTDGTLTQDLSPAINAGNIQAGLPGLTASFICYPPTVDSGSFIITPTDNAGPYNITISNETIGQDTVITIPEPFVSSSRFLLTDSNPTQTITTGSLTINHGKLILRSSTSLTPLTILPYENLSQTANIRIPDINGSDTTFIVADPTGLQTISQAVKITEGLSVIHDVVISPSASLQGSLTISPQINFSNFNTTIATFADISQDIVVTIPDPAAASLSAANFLLSTSSILTGTKSASVAGGSATNMITDTSSNATTSIIIGNWVTQANAVSVYTIVPGNGNFTVVSSGDPGASTFSYIIIN